MSTISVWSLIAADQRRQPGLARELLRRAALEHLGREVEIGHTPGRAPVVSGAAVSLSRTDDVAMCVVGRCEAIGIDIERMKPWHELRDLAALIDEAPPASAHGLLTVWTRKEALAKATGAGLPDDVRSLRVPREALEVGQWRRLDGWLWAGCPCEDGCVVSLVVRSEQADGVGVFDFIEQGLGTRDCRAWSLLLPV